jgi:predicted heme/steroid binding protein
MPRISSYPILSTPTINDLLIGTDVENFNDTKNFSIGDIGDLFFNYYVPYVGANGNVDLGIYGITGGYFAVQGGTEFQFLKADGTLDPTLYTPETRTLTINGVTYNLSEDRTWTIPLIDTLTTIGTGGPATLEGSVINIPVYQEQGDYITALTGEASASGPGSASVTLLNSAVIAKVLTGLNITGGSVVATDSILTAFGKVQNQINGLIGGVQYKGTWNAETNTPTLTSSVGEQGNYYIVSVAGNTNLNGITSWNVGDWAIFDGESWSKVDNTDAVVSVNGYTGAVELTYADVDAVPTFRTIEINGTSYDLTANRSWTVGNVRTDAFYNNPTWITGLAWSKILSTPTTLAGYGITDAVEDTTTLTINGTSYDLSANRTWNVGTITSISTIAPLTGGTITSTGTIGITQAGSVMDGYLSSTDWNTFNAKQNFMTANAPLSILADVISISQSGASSNGYLSSTDWNTFNNKQNALVNPVTGTGTVYYIPMWTGVTALSNSIISYAAGLMNFGFNNAEGASVVFTNTATTEYTYSISMNNVTRTTFHTYTDGNIANFIGATQTMRVFSNGNTIIGTGVVNNGYKLEVGGNTNIIGDLTSSNSPEWDAAYDAKINSAAVTGTTTKTLTMYRQDGGTVTASWSDYDTAPVTSVFGRLGAVVAEAGDYSTTLVTEGTNLYYLDSRARAAISSSATGLTYTTLTGVLSLTAGYSIPTNASQLTWDSAYNNMIVSAAVTGTTTKTLTLNQQDGGTITATWSDYDTAPVTSVFGRTGDIIAQSGDYSTTLVTEGTNLYFTESRARASISSSATGLTYTTSTGVLSLTSGYAIPTTASQVTWDNAYDNMIVSAAVTGTTTKTLTLNQQDGGSITASWSDYDTAPVTSVFGRLGAIVAEAGDYSTTLVTEGTNLYYTNARARQAISLTTTGTSGVATYDNGTGVLNIPNYGSVLVGYVPYTGATQSVNLGEWGLSSGFLKLDTTPIGTPTTAGTMYWDASHSTVALIMGAVTQHVGQDTYYYVKNSSGSAIPKGTAVRFAGTDGASGHLLIAPFLADGTYPSNYFMGVTAEDIANGSFGQVTHFGEIEGINTSAYGAGSLLYASTTVPGGFQTTVPSAPNNIVLVASALNSKNNGIILVRPTYGSNINDDEGVLITAPINNQGLFFDSGSGIWVNKTIAQALGYTPVPTTRTLTINGTSYDLSANRTWSVGTVTSVDLTVPTGFSVSGNPITTAGTFALTFASGYSLPTNAAQANWDTAYTNRITSLTTTGTSGAATLISNVLNIPQYQAQGNYITSLTGEATASGPGAASVTLSNSAVTGKVLTGLTVTGAVISSTDSILTAFGKLQGQVNGLMGGLQYQGTWNAATNTPTITSGVGVDGHFYIVSVAGTTTIDGITDWQVGDWIVFHDTAWQKVDNTDSVTSVNGFTGAVTLTTSNISEGTNLYFTTSRARQSISLTTSGNSGASTYDNGTGVLNVPQYTISGIGGVPTTRSLTINGTAYDLSADRSWSVGTVTSITAGTGLTGGTITSTGTIAFDTTFGDGRYLRLTGGTMTGDITFIDDAEGLVWSRNTDGGYIKFFNAGDGDTNSRLEFNTSDNNNEYFRWTHTPSGGSLYELMRLVGNSADNSILSVSGGIGINVLNLNQSALFQMDSTTKGFLPPRMTLAQRLAIVLPAEGLIVYQTNGVVGLYIYASGTWRTLGMI